MAPNSGEGWWLCREQMPAPEPRWRMEFRCIVLGNVSSAMSKHTSAESDSRKYTDQELQQAGVSPARLPRHVAIIMDGNGRWAQARKLPRIEGHRRGVRSVRTVVTQGCRLGFEQLTLFCFSLCLKFIPYFDIFSIFDKN